MQLQLATIAPLYTIQGINNETLCHVNKLSKLWVSS